MLTINTPTATFIKINNSNALRVPKACAEGINLRPGANIAATNLVDDVGL